jgi:hypothetical protein
MYVARGGAISGRRYGWRAGGEGAGVGVGAAGGRIGCVTLSLNSSMISGDEARRPVDLAQGDGIDERVVTAGPRELLIARPT